MDREIFLGVLSYVGARRQEAGGYGATPLLPATVEDTYHALRILEAFSEIRSLSKSVASFRRERPLRRYITNAAGVPWVSARTTFQVMACALSSGVALNSGKAIQYISRRLTNTLHLDERYYCARILREALHVRDMTSWRKATMSRFHKWRTARELWMKLYLQQSVSLIESSRKEEMVAWLQACQNSDGGFGFLPRTTSYIENCHTCIRALALLHAKPQDLDGCLHFVLACRTGRGGFARNPGAAPFLDATWHAVAVFSILEFS
jgi:hypothetical protein